MSDQLTREQVLSASDEQLHEWASRRIMGWTDQTSSPTFMLGDAFELFEKLRGDTSIVISSLPLTDGARWQVEIPPDIEIQDHSLPRALTIAAVLTTLETQT